MSVFAVGCWFAGHVFYRYKDTLVCDFCGKRVNL